MANTNDCYREGSPIEMTKAYRVQKSERHCGKHFRSTKKRTRWMFGFLQDSEETSNGSYKGEEHEIELVHSLLSGKIRIVWNNSDITHFFSDQRRHDLAQFQWESQHGMVFLVSAHTKPRPNSSQYSLRIGNVSFDDLPPLSRVPQKQLQLDYDCVQDETVATAVDETVAIHHPADTAEDQNLDFRLSMAGLSSASELTNQLHDDLEDELLTVSQRTTLEDMRQSVVDLIPDADAMVSRAVINALSDETGEGGGPPHEPLQIECDVLWATTVWKKLQAGKVDRSDWEEERLAFFEKQLNFVFLKVQHDDLPVDSASRILLEVASLLCIRTNELPVGDVLLFDRLDQKSDPAFLVDLCSGFVVKEAAICTPRGFGFCRFADKHDLTRALEALVGGGIAFFGNSSVPSMKTLQLQDPNWPVVADDSYVEKPLLTRRRSHQRNTITIDTASKETPFLRLVNESPTVITPLGASCERPMFSSGHSPIFLSNKQSELPNSSTEQRLSPSVSMFIR